MAQWHITNASPEQTARGSNVKSAADVTRQQWQQVKGLFESALDLAETERAAFLSEACPDDIEVRAEVQSLLWHTIEMLAS